MVALIPQIDLHWFYLNSVFYIERSCAIHLGVSRDSWRIAVIVLHMMFHLSLFHATIVTVRTAVGKSLQVHVLHMSRHARSVRTSTMCIYQLICHDTNEQGFYRTRSEQTHTKLTNFINPSFDYRYIV